MPKKFEDMTQAERMEAFEKWNLSREGRRGKSKARRTATQALIKKYQDEYNKLVAAATAKAGK